MSEQQSMMSPVGRMVQGHPMEPNDKNMTGGRLTDKQGNPRTEYFFAVAFHKNTPEINAIWAALQAEAKRGFPGGQWQYPTFAWKVKDGDQAPHNQKEGFPGHWIISFKSGFPPKVFTKGGAAQIVEKDQIKRGYFVRVHFSFAANGDQQKPGLFINPGVVELVAFGEEIQSGPDGSVFAAAPVTQLPPGASDTPIAGPPLAAAGPPVGPGTPAAAGPPVGPGTPAAAGPPVGPGMPAGVQPAPDFLNGPPGPPAPAAPTHVMTAKAGGFTYEQMTAKGWTDAQLVANGYMQPMMGDDVPF